MLKHCFLEIWQHHKHFGAWLTLHMPQQQTTIFNYYEQLLTYLSLLFFTNLNILTYMVVQTHYIALQL